MFWRKKKHHPPADFNPVVGQAARSDKKLYQAWSSWVRSQGGNVNGRLAEYMTADLDQAGFAPNPGGPGRGQGGIIVSKEEAEAIKKTNKNIDDAYTAGEIAKEFGQKLRELSHDHIEQIHEMSTTMSQVTDDVLKMQNQFRNSPDFKLWNEHQGRIITQQSDIMVRQDAILSKTGELIEVVNRSTEKIDELAEKVRAPIVGELEKYFDSKLGKDGLVDIRDALGDLIKANNALVEAYTERRK